MKLVNSQIFSSKDILRLQGLAMKVAEIALKGNQQIKREKWIKINSLDSSEPIVFADPENGWHEIITKESLECSNSLAREWEFRLLKEIFWEEHIKDDKVIEANFNVGYIYTDDGWGVELKQEGGNDNGAYHIVPPLVNYESDFNKLHFPKIIIDYEKTYKQYDLAKSIFGNILNVRLRQNWWWSLGMTWDYIKLRGMDQFMIDFILNPEWVHKTMEFLCEGYINRLSFLEEQGLLSSNSENSYVGSGGFGFSEELYKKNSEGTKVNISEMWGFAESQETVGISPEMFNEFILPYQIRVLEKFGLNCYGCCEPIDKRWKYIKSIPNLRRVSCSPWVDRKVVARELGKDYIISSKSSPTPLASPIINEDVVRKELKEIVETTRGLNVEIIMKDNHTLGNNPNNIIRWVEIAREEIGKVYQK